MKIKDILRLILIYVLVFLAGSVLYVLLMRAFPFKKIDVFFYRGLAAIFTVGLLTAAAMFLLGKTKFGKDIVFRDLLLMLCAFCCIHVVVFTHLPVTADRSVSVFMLGYMAQEDRGYAKEELEGVFVDQYVYDYDAFGKRLDEQVYTGTMKESQDNEYILTGSGKRIVGIYKFIVKVYDLDDKLVNP